MKGNNPGVITVGNRNRVFQVTAREGVRPAVAEEAAASVHNLRPLGSRVFIGREDELAVLATLPSTGTDSAVLTVRGMGGVGKTALVLRHARRHLAAGRGPVWWVDAQSPDRIEAGLAELTRALDPDAYYALPLPDAAAWAVTWLQNRTGWLVVFDNTEEPAHLDPYLGSLTGGQIVITTRRDLSWQGLGSSLHLGTLDRDDSVAVLREVTGYGEEEATAALTGLADELGDLPLALQQAGAYLAQTRTDPAAYLTDLRGDPASMLAVAAPGDEQQRTIARLWTVTLAALQKTGPDAVTVLHVLAYCAPEPLPRDVLAHALPSRRRVDQALGLLAAYSLVTLTTGDVTVHRLLQAVVRTTTSPAAPVPRPPGLHQRLLRLFGAAARTPGAAHPGHVALSLLDRATPPDDPGDVTHWPRWERLLPHVQTAAAHQDDTRPHPYLADLLGRTGVYLNARGLFTPALALQERALRIAEKALGPRHPTTAIHLGNVAATLHAAGQYAQAASLSRAALEITEAAHGHHHLHTAGALDNLAQALAALGQYEEALSLTRRGLDIVRNVLGPDHLRTALCLGNLAAALTESGASAEALPPAEEALRITEAVLGPDHPDTALRLGNLAAVYSALGRDDEALGLERKALRITEAVLGPDHPDTALRLGNLARTHVALGQYGEALPLDEEALRIARNSLGPDHPGTALRLNNLAQTLRRTGRLEAALERQQEALRITEATTGREHADYATQANNLAVILDEFGRHEEARQWKERALEVAQAALGTGHPDVANYASNLVYTLHRTGRHQEALPHARRAVQITEAALGDRHPDLAAHLNNLAQTLLALQRREEGLAIQRRALEVAEAGLGPRHPTTEHIRRKLAGATGDGPREAGRKRGWG